MASVNRVTLIGNLGRDPEVRYTPNGAAVANVSIATTRHWKDKNSGDRVEETEWHRVVFYDRLAEIAGEYLKKGSPVYIDGRLKTRKWQDKDGRDNYTTEIVAESLQLLGDRQGGGQQDGGEERPRQGSGQQRQQRPQQGQQQRPANRQTGTGFDDMDDSDVPF